MKKLLSAFLLTAFIVPMVAHADDLSPENRKAIQAELKNKDFDTTVDSIGLDMEFDFLPDDLQKQAEYIEWRHGYDAIGLSWVPKADKVFESVYDANRNVYRMTPRDFMNVCVNSLIDASGGNYSQALIRELCADSLIRALDDRLRYAALSDECRINVNEKVELFNNHLQGRAVNFFEDSHWSNDTVLLHDMTAQVQKFMNKYKSGVSTYSITYAEMARECEALMTNEIKKIRANKMHPDYHAHQEPIPGHLIAGKCRPLLKVLEYETFVMPGIDCENVMYDHDINTFWKTFY